ncbi:ESF1 homolog [Agrilus planipennis]|uniref:ESF1 homolog n=1 Tax=Agrilus planipennis TaxID=224129 RepID=A0A1W4WIL0_AGRPL|nr:ESF1 homolog [Agrilus planipennis]XP_025836058.1 ESF1 homolog [Agrilus planipennis]
MENDSRFSHIATDPKFRRIPKSERKVKIDKRFQSMFKDKQFKVKYTTDKRGRPVNHTSNEDLKRYYDLSSESESEESTDTEKNDSEVGKYVRPSSQERKLQLKSEELTSSKQLKVKHKSDENIHSDVKQKLKDLNVDYARGESKLLSESSSESEEESECDESDGVEHAWGELDHDAEQTKEVTNRFAVCNMDWDRIRAIDLMVLFNSFLPPGGVIKSVTIYPSDFGLKRMKEEEVKGPIELVEMKNEVKVNQENDEASEGSKYHMEKLRQYQLNRLKYYYAVVVCDSIPTANKIYSECDGLEYESSATKLDLRFIPDTMKFDQQPKEVCDKLPEQGKYQPRFFTTTALQQAKVDLTWDETDPTRIEVTQKLANGDSDIPEGDLQAYLASSSASEESEIENNQEENEIEPAHKNDHPIDKYKHLLHEIEKKEEEKKKKDIEMEVTWGIDIEEKTRKLVKEKMAKKDEKTPFEQYLEKRKEKRKEKREKIKKSTNNSDNDSEDSVDIDFNDPYFKEEFQNAEFQPKNKKNKIVSTENDDINNQKKAELELLLLDEDDDKKHFSLKKIQEADETLNRKRKNKSKKSESENLEKEDNFQINVNDERFSALYSSHHFNLDPTDPHFKRTKGMELLVEEKLKRRSSNISHINNEKKKLKTDKIGTELSMLVKSVKQKTKLLTKRKQDIIQ